MKFTFKELGLINIALQTKEDGSVRTFPTVELSKALSIFEKIKKNTKDNTFIDGDADFGTEEKALILSLIDRSWDIHNGETRFDVEEKLK